MDDGVSIIRKLLTGVALLFLLLVGGVAWFAATDRTDTRNVAETARKVLDSPLQFLLSIPGYEADRMARDSDLFSEWGTLSLLRKGAAQSTRLAIREELLRMAENAGWTRVEDLRDVASPEDLKRHYGIAHSKEDLDILQKLGRDEPTIYSCQIWISDSGEVILAAYRIDTN